MPRAYTDHLDALAHFPMPPCDCCGRPDCTCPVLEDNTCQLCCGGGQEAQGVSCTVCGGTGTKEPCAADCCVCDLSEPVLDEGSRP